MTLTTCVPRVHLLVSEQYRLDLLPDLAGAGVDCFQVRAKGLGTRELVGLVDSVIDRVHDLGARVVVNDRVDVALACGADGVHVGARDLDVADARRIGPDLLIGATCRTRADVAAAQERGADYAGFGPVFASSSKAGLPAPLGPPSLAAATGSLPLVAIGGIDAGNAAQVRAAGAHGVAVIGAIWRHPDPVGAAEELVAAFAR